MFSLADRCIPLPTWAQFLHDRLGTVHHFETYLPSPLSWSSKLYAGGPNKTLIPGSRRLLPDLTKSHGLNSKQFSDWPIFRTLMMTITN